jgi:general secretion pathway protein A
VRALRTIFGEVEKEDYCMYKTYFGFSESPFENTLDQRFLFLGEEHQEVLSALLYFVQTKKAFALVCGDVGTGKTMLLSSLLEQMPETVMPVLIANPYVGSQELLLYLANTLGIETTGAERVLELTDAVKSALLEAKSRDRHLILIIDEAHLLSNQALEEIRLLFNIETPDQKLLQILLVGQYELSQTLDRPEMRHLRQRINTNRFLSHSELRSGNPAIFSSLRDPWLSVPASRRVWFLQYELLAK